MLNEHNLTIASLAPKGSTKFGEFPGILVTPEETVETDGHQMICIGTPRDFRADSFPDVKAIGKAVDQYKPFTLDAATALQAAKALPKKPSIPILRSVAVVPQKDGSIRLGSTDLKQHQTYDVKGETNPQFPTTWQKCFPERDQAKFRISFNAELFEHVLAVARKTHNGQNHLVEFSFYGPSRAVRLDWKNTDTGQTNKAVVMPMRFSDDIAIQRDIMDVDRADQALALLEEFEKTFNANLEFNKQAAAASDLLKAWRKVKKAPKPKQLPEAKATPAAEAAPEATPEAKPEAKPESKPESKAETGPRSWQPEVQVKGEGDKWHQNALRFATKEEAEENARDLFSRWTLTTAHRAAPSDDEPTHRYRDGKLTPIESKPESKQPAKVKSVSFTERMKQAKTADEGRDIIAEHEKAVHDFEVLCNLPPTVGDGGSGFMSCGFSTLRPADRARMIKRVREASPKSGDAFAALVKDGVDMGPYWKTLYANEMRQAFVAATSRKAERQGSGAKGKPAVSEDLSSKQLPAAKQQKRAAAAVVTAIAAAVSSAKPHYDADYRTAKFVSHDGLSKAFQKFWKLGQPVEAKREPCEPCKGKGAVDGETCDYCGGSKIQVEIEIGPNGEPVVVDPANVEF